MGALAIGPRRNRFGNHGAPIPGHNITLVGLGTYILWLGWFGFNPGSQLDADAASISHITVTTNLAAAAGSLSALFLGWYTVGKPQLPWGLNGALAGLVSITASTNAVTPLEAVIIGAIGGVIMYYGVNFLESREVDDVVGAVSIHGFCGVWGTLAVGIFAAETGLLHGGGLDQLISQIIGIVAVAAFVIIASAIMFRIISATVGQRAPGSAPSSSGSAGSASTPRQPRQPVGCRRRQHLAHHRHHQSGSGGRVTLGDVPGLVCRGQATIALGAEWRPGWTRFHHRLDQRRHAPRSRHHRRHRRHHVLRRELPGEPQGG